MITYAIGDVHGQIGLLRLAHALIAEDRARTGHTEAPVVHIGDLVDRGPDSAAVVAYMIEGISAGEPWIVIKGNHDRMMARFLHPSRLRDPLRDDLHWLQAVIGGRTTLASYGIDVSEHREMAQIHEEARARVPQNHVEFVDGFPVSLSRGEVFFAHAGIRPGVPIAEQVEDDLVWIREPFLIDPTDHGPLIVHGHSPIEVARHYGNRVNIDSAAAYGGPLTAVRIEGRKVFELTADGSVPLEANPAAQ